MKLQQRKRKEAWEGVSFLHHCLHPFFPSTSCLDQSDIHLWSGDMRLPFQLLE